MVLITKEHWSLHSCWSHQLHEKYGGLGCSDSMKAAVRKFSSLYNFHGAAYIQINIKINEKAQQKGIWGCWVAAGST